METSSASNPKRVRPFFQVLVGATVLGLLMAGWITVISRIQGEQLAFADEATYVLPFWYLWAFFTLPVVWLAKNRPIEPGRVLSRSALHLASALLISIVHTPLQVGAHLLLRLEHAPGNEALLGYLVALTTLEAPFHLFIYAAIFGVTYIAGYRRRLRERELMATQLSEQLALAQVQALRMQINPHFLFNAMNSISMLVRDRKQEQAVRTIAGLSDLLRYVLDETVDPEVPLSRELDFIKRYLAIEQIRFQDRLRVSVSAAEDTLDALVPNLVLQPLVENAIRHGVSRSAAVTTIEISALVRGETLLLQVLDDGPGFTNDTQRSESTGLGIANTRKRLAQLYGDGYTLDLAEKTPHGVAVSLHLPLHTTPVINGIDEL